jgi:TolC family type I secretion outer membrane protein
MVLLVCLLLCQGREGEAQNEPPPDSALTLQEAVETALAQHPTLRVGQASVEAAQQRVRQQVANYLPRGGYTYTYSRQERAASSAVGGIQLAPDGGVIQRRAPSTQIYNYNSTNFNLSQLLFDFGRTLDSIRSAVAAVQASAADLETTRQAVIFNTKQAYYSTLSSQRLLQVARETVRQNQKHLEEAQARFEVGLAPRFDVTQAQVQVSNAELNLVTARHNVALARETLRTAMGVTGPFPYTLVDALEHQEFPFDDEALLTRAYANRPELHSLRAQQRSAAEQVSSLRKQYLPSISGNAQYNWTGREHPLQDGWIWGVTLTVPLFDDILTTAQVGEGQANLHGLQAQEDDLRQQIALEVRQSWLNLRQAAESIRISEQTLVQARENLDIAEGRYSTGVGNIIELTDAQVSLTSAQANNVQALYSYKTAVAQLEKAIGQPLE